MRVKRPLASLGDHPQRILVLFVPTMEDDERRSHESVHTVARCFVIDVTAIVGLWDGAGTVVEQAAQGFDVSGSQSPVRPRPAVGPTRRICFQRLEDLTLFHDRPSL
jgi:hypothetical protein